MIKNNRLVALMIAAASVATMTAANPADIIAKVKTTAAPDARQIVYEISVSETNPAVIKGQTSEQYVKDELIRQLNEAKINYIDSINVLPSDKWAQVRISGAHIRVAPGHASEMATQGIMGQPIRLLEDRGGWWRVQTPDGYIGYIVDNSLVEKTADEMAAWRKADRVIVTAPYQTRVYYTPELKGARNVVSDVVNGNILLGKKMEGINITEVELPDGRKGYISSDDIENLDQWAAQPFDAEKILELAYSMEGTPYYWGGNTVKMLDCSGLSKTCYFHNGIILMRDASQQATTGEIFKPEQWRQCEPGDLLFFGNPKTGRVTHVAIYDRDGNYIHSSGRVKRNSIDPEAEGYLSTPFLSFSRIKNSIGGRGITRVADHPWYF